MSKWAQLPPTSPPSSNLQSRELVSLDFQARWKVELGPWDQNPQTPCAETWTIKATIGLESSLAHTLHELSYSSLWVALTTFCGRATIPSTCLHPHSVSSLPYLKTLTVYTLKPWNWEARRPAEMHHLKTCEYTVYSQCIQQLLY